MRAIATALMLMIPVAAIAQQPPTQPPEIQALQESILQLTSEKLQWHAQAIALQRQVADLQRQLTEAKKPPEAPKP